MYVVLKIELSYYSSSHILCKYWIKADMIALKVNWYLLEPNWYVDMSPAPFGFIILYVSMHSKVSCRIKYKKQKAIFKQTPRKLTGREYESGAAIYCVAALFSVGLFTKEWIAFRKQFWIVILISSDLY